MFAAAELFIWRKFTRHDPSAASANTGIAPAARIDEPLILYRNAEGVAGLRRHGAWIYCAFPIRSIYFTPNGGGRIILANKKAAQGSDNTFRRLRLTAAQLALQLPPDLDEAAYIVQLLSDEVARWQAGHDTGETAEERAKLARLTPLRIVSST